MKKKVRVFSGSSSPEVTERERRNRELARRAAAEGIVLLKNEGLLPLLAERTIGLYGAGAIKTVKGGTGSGDVNERESVSIFQGLRNAGFVITSEDWIADYEKRYQQAREDWKRGILDEAGGTTTPSFFKIYSKHTFSMPQGRKIEAEELENVHTAIYVISRIAGENADRHASSGDYYLTEYEKEDIRTLCAACGNVIIILNAGGQVDVGEWAEAPQIKAVLFIGQLGMEGGNALADVLTGHATPSGKLTDTWAMRYEDFPNAKTFSHQNGNVDTEKYEEGIYVGYRYFDSFQVEPKYPFGYGMSYTDFEICCKDIVSDAGKVTLTVVVKNTGNIFSGKEVVQVYCACPQQGLAKEAKRLCGFAKTDLLIPGGSQTLTISFGEKELASFSEAQSAWLMEKGYYILQIGNSSWNLRTVGALNVGQETVIEQVSHICPLQEALEEIAADTALLSQYAGQLWQQVQEEGLPVIAYAPQEQAVQRYPQNEYEKAASEVVEKLTEEELTAMVIGEVNKAQSSALGSAGVKVPGAAGETSGILEDQWGIPGISMADGPAGLRLIKRYSYDPDTKQVYGIGISQALEGGFFSDGADMEGSEVRYQYCTAIPVGIVLAQTWNIPLLEQVGKAVAAEMQEFQVAWWLAPGMNIHRNPLCGRNFEYYSEDPLISGWMAAAMTRGVQSVPGVGTTIKHFACNNQEDNRMGSDSVLSERALREIYLRGFEIAVKDSQPMAIMTSYNKINGVHAANCQDLCIVAAREEWDFQGIIMTDWTTTYPAGGSISWECIAAGNDLIMPGYAGDFENIREALQSGKLGREELKDCVRRLITVIYQTLAFEDCRSYGSRVETVRNNRSSRGSL